VFSKLFQIVVILGYNLRMEVVGRPNIFEYDNYRVYLKAFYSWSKSQNPKFSFRFFSRIAGFQSPSFLKHVMEGERNLSPESIEKFVKALKLNKEEGDFFKNLVHFNQSTSIAERQRFSSEILKSKSYRKMHPLKEVQGKCVSYWYFSPIRELVGMPGFKEDPAWISKKLVPPISPMQAQRALDALIKSELLIRDDHGKLMQADRFIGTLDAVISSSQAHCHKELIKKAGESIDCVPREKREIGAVTLRLSAKNINKIKEMIQNLRDVIVSEASRELDPDMIYQWNFQLFPLADTKKEGG